MTSPISPELEFVLDEIARDPHAKLFVTTPRQLTLGLRGVVDWIRETQVDLTSAEQHLLATHREELGNLLIEATLAAFERNPRTACTVRRVFEEPLEPGTFERRLSQLLQVGAGGIQQTRELADGVDSGSPQKLALLSLRIRPTTRARLALALAECLALREFANAKSVLQQLSELRLDRETSSAALCNLGLCFDMEGLPHRALTCLQAAARQAPRVQCLVSTLILSMFLGDEGLASDAAAALADLPAERAAETSRILEDALYRRRAGRLIPGEMRRVFLRIEGRLGTHRDALASLCT